MKEEILKAIDKLIFAVNEHKRIVLTGKCKKINEMGGRQECIEVYEIALTALQEQLDRVEGCEACSSKRPQHNVSSPLENQLGFPHYNKFCGQCGRKLKNESEVEE